MGWIVSIHQAISYHVAATIIKLRRRNCRWYNILYALCTQKVHTFLVKDRRQMEVVKCTCTTRLHENTEVSVRLKLLPETKMVSISHCFEVMWMTLRRQL